MRKTIVLNILELTNKKSNLLNSFLTEYLKALNLTLKELKNAKSSTELHHLTYSSIRKTSFLPSDIVQEARKDVWAKRKTIENEFKYCSIRLNKRWFRYIQTKRNNPCFKITYSPRKHLVIPIKTDKQFQRFNFFLDDGWSFDNVSLFKNGKIAVVLEKEFSKPNEDKRNVIGIDIGSSTLATVTVFDTKTSKVIKQLYFGRDITVRQKRYLERRAKLRSLADKGSSRAKKSLKRLKRKQFNFVKTRSGQVAKEITKIADKYNASVSVEKLRKIRGKKGKFRKKTNRKISNIPYGKFIEFLKSNAEMFSIPFYQVSPYHTSKWCSTCGAVNKGHHSGNYSLYKCKECGLIVNSDRKSSLAVAIKSLLERKTSHKLTVSSCFQISNRQVPVNGLLRRNDVGLSKVVVRHSNQPTESLSTCR